MKILFVTAFPLEINSSATIQNKIIIDGLLKLGHKVEILTTEISCDSIAFDNTMNNITSLKTYRASLASVYTNMQNKKNQAKIVTFAKMQLRKVYNYFKIYDGYKTCIPSIGKINFESTEYDIVISSSDPKSSHLMAKSFLEKYRTKNMRWIQYWGDPMYLDITRKKRLFDWQIKFEETKLLELADKVIYATPFTVMEQRELYSDYKHKMEYVTQGYVDFTNVDSKKNDKYTIGYFGNYNSKIRNIKELYLAAEEKAVYDLLICGSSDITLDSKQNIKVYNQISYAEVQEREQGCDLLICLCNNRGTQIPGKIYYYASYQKPILVILDGENANKIKEFLSRYNRYYFCENKKDSINAAIEKIKKISLHEYSDIELLAPEYIAKNIIK